MPPQPLISIVCCTHNRVGFVRTHFEALKPHLDQRIELLYALDNCTDGTADYLGKAAADMPNVRVEHHTGPRGLFNCRNFGLAQSRGQFIHYLDDDDGVEQGYHLQLCDALAQPQNSDTDVYMTRLRVKVGDKPAEERDVISGDLRSKAERLGSELHFRGDLFPYILDGRLYYYNGNALFSRKLLTQYGFREGFKKSADWLFNMEAALCGPLHVAYSETAVADYFIHPASMSLGPDKAYWNARIFDVLLDLAQRYPRHQDAIRRTCAQANFDAGYCLRRVDRRRALAHYWRAFRLGLGFKPLLAIGKLAITPAQSGSA
jgi:glycosyltransferase involved in cell wall biosynthesis